MRAHPFQLPIGSDFRAARLDLRVAGACTALVFAACSSERSDASASSVQSGAAAASRPGGVHLVDRTEASQVEFAHRRGDDGRLRLEEIMSGGCALFDADRDGDLDLFLVHGDPSQGSWGLWRNDGTGVFVDCTAAIGAVPTHFGMGCAAGDFDGDGWVDLYVTQVGPDLLLRNVQGVRFEDATADVGLGRDDGFSTSAAWLDADADGDLDLYVARYFDRSSPDLVCRNARTNQRDYCSPLSYRPVSDLFFRNDSGRFVDVSAASGVASKAGYGLAVTVSDLDSDGMLDIYVANDQSAAFLWRGRGDGTFDEVALARGCAFDRNGRTFAGMGIVAEDFDGDADLDLFVTNICEQPNLFFRRDGDVFRDVSGLWGETKWLRPYTGFGVACVDVNLDGEFELYVANGAVSAQQLAPAVDPYAEPDSLVRFNGARFVDASTWLGEAAAPDVARGVSSGDLDGDGVVDLVVARNGDAPRILRAEAPSGAHWIAVDVLDERGSPLLNSLVEIHVDGRARVREVRAQDSYLASRGTRAHFGLGSAERVERVIVRLPGGRGTKELVDVAADQVLVVKETDVR